MAILLSEMQKDLPAYEAMVKEIVDNQVKIREVHLSRGFKRGKNISSFLFQDYEHPSIISPFGCLEDEPRAVGRKKLLVDVDTLRKKVFKELKKKTK